jgi:hypothetical protein
MAKIVVEVPDGEFCKHCKFRVKGTIWCSLFEEYLEESEDDINKIKCEKCPRTNQFISQDGMIISLPVPLGSKVYTYSTDCNNMCMKQKALLKTWLNDENDIHCHPSSICHMKIRHIESMVVTLFNLITILTQWNKKIFATEEEALEAGNKIIEEHKKTLLSFGFEIE